MGKATDERIFDELDCQIIAGLGLGMTQEAVGNWVCTPEFPAGVSERTVRNRIAANRDAYDRCLFRVGTAFKKKQEEFEDLTKQQYREKLAKLRSKGLRVKEQALDTALQNPLSPELLGLGVKVAESIENRDFGNAKQVVETYAEGRVDHFVWTSDTRQQLIAQERDMFAAEMLLKALPGDVLEAELVETETEA